MDARARRVILAAVQAALEDEGPAKKRRKARLSAGRALLLGAGLMTAGRLAAGSRGREVVGSLQQRLADFEEQYLSDDELPEDVDADEELLDEEEEPAPARNRRNSRSH